MPVITFISLSLAFFTPTGQPDRAIFLHTATAPASDGRQISREGISRTDTTRQLNDAPDFTLTQMNGESFTLSEHEGKVVVLNIWATWCGPCRKEIPDFVEIQEEMRDEDVLFVGVSLDEEGWEVVRPFARKYEVNYPLVVDDGSVFDGYGPFRGIPMTFVINKKGKLEYVAPGMVNKKTIKPILEKLARR
ncbi:Peroxiredoxin [Fodinibius roseus]|uniref:Peroxiredoxin n=2 Tax=Fodinibius roseus TaxID=1194090 RepID=A0A1M4WGR1_9BACT|nr:Peroxiredoxin [Fodinibius roseus]